MEAVGFRRLLSKERLSDTVELPQFGMLEDGRPLAVRFRQPNPAEWWMIRRHRYGTLPIQTTQTDDERELERMEAETADDEETLKNYEYLCEVVGVAVTHIRDCQKNEHGEFMEQWHPCSLVPRGKLDEMIEEDGVVQIPIEWFERGTAITDIANAITAHANTGGHNIKEVEFREGASSAMRETGEQVQGTAAT